MWLYDVDTAAGVVRYHARRSDHTVELPLKPMHGTLGGAPAAFEVRSTIVPDAHGGNLDTPEIRAGVTAYFGVNVLGALSPSATDTPAKAAARSAGWPSRQP